MPTAQGRVGQGVGRGGRGPLARKVASCRPGTDDGALLYDARRPGLAVADLGATARICLSPSSPHARNAPAPGNLGAGGSGSRLKSTRTTLRSRPITKRLGS